ncbi:F-box domain-containing protein [Purpureocillium lavendulum]|uniref:F-box domain-containing protein n=1 Tax=Purpureocillium lavendulum TaxID=1247861 RepID=A0AB34G7T4_9HYPO|nr:F-box domain-containing protein [Purpureocillium lavendulum]
MAPDTIAPDLVDKLRGGISELQVSDKRDVKEGPTVPLRGNKELHEPPPQSLSSPQGQLVPLKGILRPSSAVQEPKETTPSPLPPQQDLSVSLRGDEGLHEPPLYSLLARQGPIAPLRGILRPSSGVQEPKETPPSSLLPWPEHREDSGYVPPIQLVPNDIILCVLDFCSPTDRLSLALTCQSLYRFFDSSIASKAATNAALLALLERDLPHVFFCRSCDRLHPWQRHEPTDVTRVRPDDLVSAPLNFSFTYHHAGPQSPYEGSLGCAVKMHYSPRYNSVYYLPFYYARLAVNAHRIGPERGIPIHHLGFAGGLSDKAIRRRRRRGHVINITGGARIIDGELYMGLLYVWYCKRDSDPEDLRSFLDETPLFVCCSLRTDAYNDAECTATSKLGQRIPWLERPASGNKPFQDGENLLGFCGRCLTDYSVSFFRAESPAVLIVALRTYQLFGRCRSPSDAKWRLMTGDVIPGLSRVNYAGYGVVRDRFREVQYREYTSRGRQPRAIRF